MANGVQLATAYISLNVRTDDIKKQVDAAFRSSARQGQQAGVSMGSNLAAGLRSSFGSRIGSGAAIFAPLQLAGVRWAARAGTTIAMTLKNAIVGAMKTAGVAAGVGAGLGVGEVLLSGLDRLKVLQGAQVQLRVMKKSATEIKQITDDILAVVQGTPISLDAAMQAVPQALGAGVKQGQELKQYIQDIGDAAASTGGKAGFGQISMIFSQILGKGRLMAEEVLQLEENGVRVRNALKNSLGVDDKQLTEMLAKGKIGMAEVQKAVQSTFGGLSRQMGDTFEGATGNLKASVARLGANILGVIFGDPNNPDDPLKGATDGITNITASLDKAGKWVNENREEIRGFFRSIGDAASWVGERIGDVIDFFRKMGDTGRDISTRLSTAWDKVTTAVGRMGDKIKTTVDTIKTKFTDIIGDVEKKFNSIFGENGWFAQQFKKLGELVDKVRDVLGLGPATANAAAPSAGGAAPFNPGPMAPNAQVPGTGPGGGTITAQATPGVSGTLGVPGVSDGINRGPMKPTGQQPGGGVIRGTGRPYGLPAGTDTGGYGSGGKVFPDWVHQLGAKYGVKPSTYAGHQEGSGMNQGIDWVGTVEQMQAFAEALIKARPPGLEQVIWQNPTTSKVLGLTPGGEVVTVPDGYYRNDWSGHQDHVHTRFSQELDLSGYAGGGGVWGAGTAKSDSIPAMLSNGEHVLTAEDVKAMGGQSNVYAFRAALQKGIIPGFAPGGAVDPSVIEDAQNQLFDLDTARVTAQKQLAELPSDATAVQRLQAEINAAQAQREWEQANADLPIISSGGTPPDRSLQNNVFSTTDSARLALAQLEELRARVAAGDDIPGSQIYAAEGAATAAQRDRQLAIEALQQRDAPPNFLDEFMRTGGFIPTAAGNTGVAGTSALSSIIGMGNEVVGGLIDTGASLLQTAAQAGITAGTMGAGAAAGPAAGAAASYGIQLGASVAKRLSSYGFQLASIGADSLIAQLFPFGAPRWIGYDYTGFMPQLGVQQAALTTIEKMGNQAIQRYFNPQGQGVIPPLNPQGPAATPLATPEAPGPQPLVPTQGLLQQGDPGFFNPPTDVTIDPFNPFGAGGAGGGGSWANGGAIRVYDQGGVLRPGDLALNASTRPERILTDKQWDALSKIQPANQSGPMVKIDAIYGFSPEDVATQIESKQKLAMMRYAGRP